LSNSISQQPIGTHSRSRSASLMCCRRSRAARPQHVAVATAAACCRHSASRGAHARAASFFRRCDGSRCSRSWHGAVRRRRARTCHYNRVAVCSASSSPLSSLQADSDQATRKPRQPLATRTSRHHASNTTVRRSGRQATLASPRGRGSGMSGEGIHSYKKRRKNPRTCNNGSAVEDTR